MAEFGLPALQSVADEIGWSALHRAAFWGDLAAVEVLLRGGAAVDTRTPSGRSPLHLAATECSSCCRALLDAGAEVNAVTDDGLSPLHYAASWNNVDCAVLLLAAGADACRWRGGHTPAEVAARRGHVALASLLADAARWGGLRRAALTAWCSPVTAASSCR